MFAYGEVYYNNYKFSVRVCNLPNNKIDEDYYSILILSENSTVVGNIFENEDLLK